MESNDVFRFLYCGWRLKNNCTRMITRLNFGYLSKRDGPGRGWVQDSNSSRSSPKSLNFYRREPISWGRSLTLGQAPP